MLINCTFQVLFKKDYNLRHIYVWCTSSADCSALVVPPRHHPFNLTHPSGPSFGLMLGRAQSPMTPTSRISQLDSHCPSDPGPNSAHGPGPCDQRPSGLTQPRYRGLALGEEQVQKQRGMLLITFFYSFLCLTLWELPLSLYLSVWTPCGGSSGYSESVRKQCTVTGEWY